MTDSSPRAVSDGAFSTPVLRRRHGSRSTILAALLLAGLGTATTAGDAEAAERTRPHATMARHAAMPATPRTLAAKRHAAPERPVTAAASAIPGPEVLSALRRAETVTGIDPALLLAIARRESGFDPAARNRRSSARGLMQFTTATWLEVVRDFGQRHGLARQAAALSAAPRGSVPRDPRLVAEVLRLRDDPQLAAALTAERLESGRGPLEQVLGRPATPADLYLVHLLGPAGARRFLAELTRTPGRPATEVMGAAAGANRALFIQGGRALSLAEVHREVASSLTSDAVAIADVSTAVVLQVADAR